MHAGMIGLYLYCCCWQEHSDGTSNDHKPSAAATVDHSLSSSGSIDVIQSADTYIHLAFFFVRLPYDSWQALYSACILPSLFSFFTSQHLMPELAAWPPDKYISRVGPQLNLKISLTHLTDPSHKYKIQK